MTKRQTQKYVTIDTYGTTLMIPMSVFSDHYDDIYVVDTSFPGTNNSRKLTKVQKANRVDIFTQDDVDWAMAQSELEQ